MIIKDQILDEHKNKKFRHDDRYDPYVFINTLVFVLSNPFSHIKLILVVLRFKLLNQFSAFTVFKDPTIIIV